MFWRFIAKKEATSHCGRFHNPSPRLLSVMATSFLILSGCGSETGGDSVGEAINKNVSVTVNNGTASTEAHGWWNTSPANSTSSKKSPISLPSGVSSIRFSASDNSVQTELHEVEDNAEIVREEWDPDELLTSEYGVLTGEKNRQMDSEGNIIDNELRATELLALSDQEVIEKIGPMLTEDQRSSGILASVSLAQFLLESGYGRSELAQETNNCFGMKCSLSDSTWPGSTWDGRRYNKSTKEETPAGEVYSTTADFRVYDSIAESIEDHSAYLRGAEGSNGKRYEGIVGEQNYREALQIIKNGGYATDNDYVEDACSIIERYGLTKYDLRDG